MAKQAEGLDGPMVDILPRTLSPVNAMRGHLPRGTRAGCRSAAGNYQTVGPAKANEGSVWIFDIGFALRVASFDEWTWLEPCAIELCWAMAAGSSADGGVRHSSEESGEESSEREGDGGED